MASLTTKELSALDDQIGYEQVLVKKFRTMASQCSDTVIKNKLDGMANIHQKHYDKLITYLQ